MQTKIEIMDRKRVRYLTGHITGIIIFLIVSLIELLLKLSGVPLEDIRIISLPLMIFSIVLQVFFIVMLVLLSVKINNDETLKDALNNELVVLNRLKAWRIAFIVLAVCITILGILSVYYNIDTIFAVLISVVAGSGAYNIGFLILDRG